MHRFSLGHGHHGDQMTVGWRTPNPTSLHDYDEGLCNIDIESWVFNLMRSNRNVEYRSDWIAQIATCAKGNSALVIDVTKDLPNDKATHRFNKNPVWRTLVAARLGVNPADLDDITTRKAGRRIPAPLEKYRKKKSVPAPAASLGEAGPGPSTIAQREHGSRALKRAGSSDQEFECAQPAKRKAKSVSRNKMYAGNSEYGLHSRVLKLY